MKFNGWLVAGTNAGLPAGSALSKAQCSSSRSSLNTPCGSGRAEPAAAALDLDSKLWHALVLVSKASTLHCLPQTHTPLAVLFQLHVWITEAGPNPLRTEGCATSERVFASAYGSVFAQACCCASSTAFPRYHTLSMVVVLRTTGNTHTHTHALPCTIVAAGVLWHYPRCDHHGQGDWWWPASGCLWRQEGDHGDGGTCRTHVPGRQVGYGLGLFRLGLLRAGMGVRVWVDLQQPARSN